MTSTYNPRLAKVKVDPLAKNQGQTVQTGEHPQTNERTHTHGRYQMYYLPCYAVDNGVSLTDRIYLASLNFELAVQLSSCCVF